MLAKSHVGIGVLGGLLLKGSLTMSSGPAALLLMLFNIVPGVARYILLVALTAICIVVPEKTAQVAVPLALIAGCLFPDLDHPNSTGSNLIAPTQLVLRVMVGAAGVVLAYLTFPNAYGIVGGLMLVITAVLNLKCFPSEKIQRLMLIVGGLFLMAFDVGMLSKVIGIVYISMGVLSHRGLTHSTEGLLIASVGMWVWASKVGYPQLIAPFVLGYSLHLLADMITDSGIYVSYFGNVKFGIPLIKTSGLIDRLISMGTLAMAIVLSVASLPITEKIFKVVQ